MMKRFKSVIAAALAAVTCMSVARAAATKRIRRKPISTWACSTQD